MQRQEWMFEFSADALKKACDVKVNLHTERRDAWTATRDAAEQKLRTEGIDFRSAAQFTAANQGYSTVSNSLPKPVFDNQLLTEFNEALAKVTEHESRLRDYAAYQRAFGLLCERNEGGKVFELHADDVQYFGI